MTTAFMLLYRLATPILLLCLFLTYRRSALGITPVICVAVSFLLMMYFAVDMAWTWATMLGALVFVCMALKRFYMAVREKVGRRAYKVSLNG